LGASTVFTTGSSGTFMPSIMRLKNWTGSRPYGCIRSIRHWGQVIVVAPLALLGFNLQILGTTSGLLTFWAIFIHSNVRWSFGPLRQHHRYSGLSSLASHQPVGRAR
jgi:hypothetical protein